MKKKHVIIAALHVVVIIVLAVSLITVNIKVNELKKGSISDIYSSVRMIEERISNIVHSGTYSHSDSEQIQSALGALDQALKTTEKLYGKKYEESLSDLKRSLGSYYSAEHNGTPVESVLFDGEVSEKELDFLTTLHTDLKSLLLSMSADDGINMLDGLIYEDFEDGLNAFLKKWGDWSQMGDSPYTLLNAE